MNGRLQSGHGDAVSRRRTWSSERGYVDDIIYCEWILRHLRRTEIELNTYVYEHACHTHPDYPMGQPAAERPKLFSALTWRMISTPKALREAVAALRELRANPIPDAPPEPAIGFVFESSPHTEPRPSLAS